MSDVTLADGREIEFDLSKITIEEYRALFDPTQPNEEEYEILAKCARLKADEVRKLSLADWKRFGGAFFKKAREPLADPN
jgi:hypothetical protein